MMTIERLDVADAGEAAAAARDLVLQAAGRAIDARGRFVFVLAGGATPKALYRLLADEDQDWHRWHLIYGDERCLPEGDPQRNATLVAQTWLDRCRFPPQNHHVADGGLDPERAAAAYASVIANLLPPDLALLGMGQDGHTASLFPGQYHADAAVVPVHNAPKPPAERISLSYSTLSSARMVCYLVVGEDKREVIAAFCNGEDLPVSRVHGTDRTVLISGGLTPR